MMALAERPDPRRKLLLAAALDSIIVLLGVALFVTSGSLIWIFGSLAIGAAVSVPLIISAMREIKEQKDASR
jgi:cyanate permease